MSTIFVNSISFAKPLTREQKDELVARYLEAVRQREALQAAAGKKAARQVKPAG